MINPDRFERQGVFVMPDYARFGLSRVPAAVRALLAGERTELTELCPAGRPKRVVLLVIDGFGFDQWVKYQAQFAFLRRVSERGVVSPITTVFPSTTSAAITTLHTGLTPLEHGVAEWWLWLDELGGPIETMLWRGLRGEELGEDMRILYGGPTFYETLAKAGIECRVVLPELYAFSAYSNHFSRGAKVTAARSLRDQLAKVREALEHAASPAYVYTHWGGVDKAAHAHGPHTQAHVDSIAEIAGALQSGVAGWPEGTLLIITADHGQVVMDVERTVQLKRHPEVMRLVDGLPWGSPRDLFMRAKPGAMAELKEHFGRLLAGQAVVMETEEAFRRELFGPGQPDARFRRRVGDLIVLPYGTRGAWYELKPGFRFELPGQHGSLTADEMLVPFAAVRPGDLSP